MTTNEVADVFDTSAGSVRRWLREDPDHPLWRARIKPLPGQRKVRFQRQIIEEILRDSNS